MAHLVLLTCKNSDLSVLVSRKELGGCWFVVDVKAASVSTKHGAQEAVHHLKVVSMEEAWAGVGRATAKVMLSWVWQD